MPLNALHEDASQNEQTSETADDPLLRGWDYGDTTQALLDVFSSLPPIIRGRSTTPVAVPVFSPDGRTELISGISGIVRNLSDGIREMSNHGSIHGDVQSEDCDNCGGIRPIAGFVLDLDKSSGKICYCYDSEDEDLTFENSISGKTLPPPPSMIDAIEDRGRRRWRIRPRKLLGKCVRRRHRKVGFELDDQRNQYPTCSSELTEKADKDQQLKLISVSEQHRLSTPYFNKFTDQPLPSSVSEKKKKKRFRSKRKIKKHASQIETEHVDFSPRGLVTPVVHTLIHAHCIVQEKSSASYPFHVIPPPPLILNLANAYSNVYKNDLKGRGQTLADSDSRRIGITEKDRQSLAITLQSFIRKCLARSNFEISIKAVQQIQALVRQCLSTSDYQRSVASVILIQSAIRCAVMRGKYVRSRVAAGLIERVFRGFVARKDFIDLLAAAEERRLLDEAARANKKMKLVIIGAPSCGKTSIVKRLLKGKKAKKATLQTKFKPQKIVGVNVHKWNTSDDPLSDGLQSTKFPDLNELIRVDYSSEDDINVDNKCDVEFNLYDFSGPTGFHKTQELFFSPHAVYVVVWDMATHNPDVKTSNPSSDDEFSCSDEEGDDADQDSLRALKRDIDMNVQTWIDRIQRYVPGATILPVASFDDYFYDYVKGGVVEAERRCNIMKARLLDHARQRQEQNLPTPKLIFGPGKDTENALIRLSSENYRGFGRLRETIISAAVSEKTHFEHPLNDEQIRVKEVIELLKERGCDVISMNELMRELEVYAEEVAEENVCSIVEFLRDIGIVSYFSRKRNATIQSSYVFLKPRPLVAALRHILNHGMKERLDEAKDDLNFSGNDLVPARKLFCDYENLKCPLVSSHDLNLLWKVGQLAIDSLRGKTTSYYSMLQELFIDYRILVPINTDSSAEKNDIYFVPALLDPGSPFDNWAYKCKESWMTTICTSWLFIHSVPSNLMELVSASLLRDLNDLGKRRLESVSSEASAIAQSNSSPLLGSSQSYTSEIDRFHVHQMLCWRSTLIVKFRVEVIDKISRERKYSNVEVLVQLVGQSCETCVASENLTGGRQRLVVCGKGPEGGNGQRIWSGGYGLVLGAVERAINSYNGIRKPKKEIVCPKCLTNHHIRKAKTWNYDYVKEYGDREILCLKGHSVNTGLICGLPQKLVLEDTAESSSSLCTSTPVSDIFPAVVVVGLYDRKQNRITKVGSGFIVDKKLGLIVTAAHTLFNLTMDRNKADKDYFDLKEKGTAVIGIIPRSKDTDTRNGPARARAIFRYMAEVVEPVSRVELNRSDVCVLRIKTRLHEDVGDELENLFQEERVVLKPKKLKNLAVSVRIEHEEQIRVLGYNQGGEGITGAGQVLNRTIDLAKGYICRLPEDHGHEDKDMLDRKEIVAMCPTISGHSGGPCVNQNGEVIGILSRADPVDKQRCYIVPSSEFIPLVESARKR